MKERQEHRFLAGPQTFLRYPRFHLHTCVCVYISPADRLICAQASVTTMYPHDGMSGGNENHNYDYGWTGFGCNHRHVSHLSPTPRADVTLTPPIQSSSTTGVFHHEGQLSSIELNYDQDPYDGGWSRFSSSEETYPPTGYHPRPDYVQATGVISRGDDARENASPSLSRPAGMVSNEGAIQVPAESPPRYLNKRKRAATLDGGREGKRARHRKPQNPNTRQQTLVSTVRVDPI